MLVQFFDEKDLRKVLRGARIVLGGVGCISVRRIVEAYLILSELFHR